MGTEHIRLPVRNPVVFIKHVRNNCSFTALETFSIFIVTYTPTNHHLPIYVKYELINLDYDVMCTNNHFIIMYRMSLKLVC